MANIAEYLNKIINAIYGRDVRRSIHDGIAAINKEVESTTTRQTNLEKVHEQLIINAGNSNAEVVDARVDKVTGDSYNTIGNRMDETSKKLAETNAQLSEINEILSKDKISLIADVDGTDYKTGDVVDVSFLTSEQLKNYSHLMKKLHTKEFVSIICRGDSLTYGYDIESVDRIEPSTVVTDLGTTHVRTRASKQYPQMLAEYLRQYGYDVSVSNLGYSGAWVKSSFDLYYKKRTNNLEFIMLGTNDSRLSSCPYVGDVKKFVDYYEQLIIREILFGNGLVLIQPINTRSTKDIAIETFRTAIYLLGNKYKIPVIDGSEILNNHSFNIWSDGTHLNGVGYSILACGIANSVAVQDLTQPKQLFNGTLLLTRPTIDSCCYVNENAVYFNASAGYTPDSVVDGGRLACRLNKGGEVIYTFYNNVENLVLLPTIYMNANSKVRFQLNFGLPQAKTPLTTSNYQFTSWDGTLPNEFVLTNDRTSSYTYSKVTANKDLIDNQPLILANKGFYSLRITNITDSNVDDGSANLFGIECMGIENWYNLCNRSKYRRLYTNNEGVGAVETTIKLSESMNNFDVLALHTHFFGYETHIVDFSTGTLQYIKHINLVDDDTDLRTAYNEIRLQKIDEYNIKITLNKSIVRDSNGSSILINTEDYLGKIRGVTGIKY